MDRQSGYERSDSIPTFLQPLRWIHRVVTTLALCSLAYGVHGAQTYSFSYRFASGDIVTGSFTGTASGNLITGLTNISVFINGVPFRGNGHVYNLGWVYNQQLPGNPGSAVASFDGKGNAFGFYDYNPSGPYDPNGKEFSSNPYFGGQTTYAYFRNAGSSVFEGEGCSCSTAAYKPANWTVTPTSTTNPPVANFTWSPSAPNAGDSVQFTDTSTRSPTAWSWTFGDGATSSSRNPKHKYASAGNYTVTLTATNAGGSDSESKTVSVSVIDAKEPVIHSFTADPAIIAQGHEANLRWSTSDATSVTISGGVGSRGPNSSATVSPHSTTTFTLTAYGSASKVATASVVVEVKCAPEDVVQALLATRALVNPSATCPLPSLPSPPNDTWERFGPPASWLSSDVEATLDTAMNQLKQDLLTGELKLTVARTSGYRPLEYQRHFFELRCWFAMIVEARRATPNIESQCSSLIAELNREIDQVHGIVRKATGSQVAGKGAPSVNPPFRSNHTLKPAMAVDLNVHPEKRGLTNAQMAIIDQIAASRNVHRPCKITDPVHFELIGTSIDCGRSNTVVGRAFSPVAILLTAPDGRRIGFDPAIGQKVNDFGESGYYTGPNSEPQEVIVSGVEGGVFVLTGIGTGDGPYRLDLDVYPAEEADGDEDTPIAHTTATGTASLNQPIKQLTVVAPQEASKRRTVRH